MRKRTVDYIVVPGMLIMWLAMGLGVLLWVAGPCIRARFNDESTTTPTAATLQVLWAGLLLYRAEAGTWPPNLEDIKPVVLRKDVPITDDSFFDEWHRPFHYSLQDAASVDQGFELFSTGENGKDEHDQPGRGDDILIGTDGEIIAADE